MWYKGHHSNNKREGSTRNIKRMIYKPSLFMYHNEFGCDSHSMEADHIT